MGTQQSLMTMFAMMMLSMLALRMNSTMLRTQDSMQNSKFGLAAVSLSISRIEQATRVAFDEASINTPLVSTNSLTAPGSLGPESGETALDDFDDFDDFNNYTVTDNSMNFVTYTVTSKVVYVSDLNPNVTSSTRTWHKKITVTTTCPFMRDTISMSSIVSYWYFR